MGDLKKVFIYYYENTGKLYTKETRYVEGSTQHDIYEEVFNNPRYSNLTMVIMDGEDGVAPRVDSRIKIAVTKRKNSIF